MSNDINLIGNTKKEKLMYLFETCKENYITLAIVNPDMLRSEYITVFRPDFKHKAEIIDRDYNDDLKLHRNDRIKIEAVLGTVFLEEFVYID